MSSSIWTRCGARANLGRLGGRAWRLVEGQHLVSTRKLVDSLEEQEILEGLIERVKPAVPAHEPFRGLHYLLSTPFRYPPLPHGSRFATRAEPSLWYGAARPRTACAESAYYRLLFLQGTRADLGTLSIPLSLFSVPLSTARGVDLRRPPFDAHRDVIASRVDYRATQALGREMRADGVEAFRYPSARDSKGGVNVGLFSPAAFGARRPSVPETWHCAASRERVEFAKHDVFTKRTHVFERCEFEVDGKLPLPAP